jgi:hypothetical protein
MAVLKKAYTTVQVTLTANSNPSQQLWALANAIDSAVPQAASSVTIQADPANTAAILIGDASTTATRFGYSLTAGGSRTYDKSSQAVLFGFLYAFTTGTGQKLNIEVMTS